MKKNNDYKGKNKLKNIGKGVAGATEMLSGIVLSTPITGCVGLPIVYDGAVRLGNCISRYSNTDSLITSKVEDKTNRRIVQNAPNFKQMVEIGVESNKLEALVYQELKFLLNADIVNEYNEILNYNTKSQALTKRLLKQAEKCGIITNFKSEKIGSKSLPIEKIILGNINKDIFKRNSIFNMSFNISNNPITKEMLNKFGKSLNVDLTDDKKYNFNYDEQGNVIGIKLNKSRAIINKFKKDDKNLLESKDIKFLAEYNKDKEFNDKLKEATNSYENIIINEQNITKKEDKQIDNEIR